MLYTIQPGDTLQSITIRFTGDRANTGALWDINKADLGIETMTDIQVGQMIEIPDQLIAKPELLGPVDDDGVYLYVNGKRYGGWKSVRITRSLEAVAGSFEVTLSDVWEPRQEPWEIYDGDRVVVCIGNDRVISGWVDTTEASISAEDHSLTVAGRDYTCDIVDCSAINKPGEWRNKSVEAICKDICAPYGVKVLCEVDTGADLPVFRLQPAEKCIEAMVRLAQGRGLFITGTAKGEVLITRVSTARVPFALVQGENILAATGTSCSQEQFSKYVVEGYKGDAKPKKHGTSTADAENGFDLSR